MWWRAAGSGLAQPGALQTRITLASGFWVGGRAPGSSFGPICHYACFFVDPWWGLGFAALPPSL